jgi:hypothetical protein
MTSTPGSAPASVVERLQRLKTCAAATCRSIEDEGGGTPPPPTPNPNLLTANQSSVETDLSGFTGIWEDLHSRDTTQAQFGSASVKVDITATEVADAHASHGVIAAPGPNDVLPANTNVIGSVYVKAPAGKTIWTAIRASDPGAVFIGEGGWNTFTATGAWQRINTTPATFGQDFRPGMQVAVNDSEGPVTFNADGFKIEQGSTVTDWNLGTGGGG